MSLAHGASPGAMAGWKANLSHTSCLWSAPTPACADQGDLTFINFSPILIYIGTDGRPDALRRKGIPAHDRGVRPLQLSRSVFSACTIPTRKCVAIIDFQYICIIGYGRVSC